MNYQDSQGRRVIFNKTGQCISHEPMPKRNYEIIDFEIGECRSADAGVWLVSYCSSFQSHSITNQYAIDMHLSWAQAVALRNKLDNVIRKRMK